MIKIAVVTHKEYEMPKEPMYVPVMAGSVLCAEVPYIYTRDDRGDNISDRNGTFSELTALYWLWKHHAEEYPDADCLGLCHYRRLFAAMDGRHKRLLNETDVNKLMNAGVIVLPKVRNYLIETNYSHYANAHHAADLDLTREIISEKHPLYLHSFDKCMSMKKGHRFNMFIMPASELDDYCKWLFDILFELEKRLDISGYIGRDRRVFGLVAERLLDIWIDANQKSYKDIPYIMKERESIVVKGATLLFRKIKGIMKNRIDLTQ